MDAEKLAFALKVTFALLCTAFKVAPLIVAMYFESGRVSRKAETKPTETARSSLDSNLKNLSNSIALLNSRWKRLDLASRQYGQELMQSVQALRHSSRIQKQLEPINNDFIAGGPFRSLAEEGIQRSYDETMQFLEKVSVGAAEPKGLGERLSARVFFFAVAVICRKTGLSLRLGTLIQRPAVGILDVEPQQRRRPGSGE